MSNINLVKISVKSFDKICRTCSAEGNLSPIYENAIILNILETCTQIKFNKNDNLPNQICSKCISTLNQMYNFINTCQIVNLAFKQCLNYQNESITDERPTQNNLYNESELQTTLSIDESIIKHEANEICIKEELLNADENYFEASMISNFEENLLNKTEYLENQTAISTLDTTNNSISSEKSNKTPVQRSSKRIKNTSFFEKEVFMLPSPNLKFFPLPEVQTYLQSKGLGKSKRKAKIYHKWSLSEIKEHILSLYSPTIATALKKVDFKFAKCRRGRKIIKLTNITDGRKLRYENQSRTIVILPNKEILKSIPNNNSL